MLPHATNTAPSEMAGAVGAIMAVRRRAVL